MTSKQISDCVETLHVLQSSTNRCCNEPRKVSCQYVVDVEHSSRRTSCRSPLNNFDKPTCFELKLKLKFVKIYEKVEFTVFLNLAEFSGF